MRGGVRHRSAVGGLGVGIGLLLAFTLVPMVEAAQGEPQATEPKKVSLEERADIFMARKGYADAVNYYQRALKLTGNSDAQLWNKLGIAYQQLGNNRSARKAYNEAVRCRKDYSEALNNIGATYFFENKYAKSIKYYLRSLQVNPHSASIHLNLGTAYYHRKNYVQAMDEYREALRLDPNVLAERSMLGPLMQTRGADARYYFYWAKVFASYGRAEEAVRNLRRALEDGFNDFDRIKADPDLKKISQFPAFVELLNNPPVPIK